MKTSLRGYVTEIDLNTDYEIEEAESNIYIKVAGDTKPAIYKLKQDFFRDATLSVNLSEIVEGATGSVQIPNIREDVKKGYFKEYYIHVIVQARKLLVIYKPKETLFPPQGKQSE